MRKCTKLIVMYVAEKSTQKIHKLEIKNVNELDRTNNYYIDMICEDCKNQLVSIVDNEKTSRGNIVESN